MNNKTQHTPGPWRRLKEENKELREWKRLHSDSSYSGILNQLQKAESLNAELLDALKYFHYAAEIHEREYSDSALEGECSITVTLKALRDMAEAISKAEKV